MKASKNEFAKFVLWMIAGGLFTILVLYIFYYFLVNVFYLSSENSFVLVYMIFIVLLPSFVAGVIVSYYRNVSKDNLKSISVTNSNKILFYVVAVPILYSIAILLILYGLGYIIKSNNEILGVSLLTFGILISLSNFIFIKKIFEKGSNYFKRSSKS